MTTKEIPRKVTLYSHGIVISVVKSSNLRKAWNRERWMVCLDADHGENYANVCWWGKSREDTLR